MVVDDPANQQYPMPMDAHEKDEVFVGRLRRDETQPNTLNMWIVSDNLERCCYECCSDCRIPGIEKIVGIKTVEINFRTITYIKQHKEHNGIKTGQIFVFVVFSLCTLCHKTLPKTIFFFYKENIFQNYQ